MAEEAVQEPGTELVEVVTMAAAGERRYLSEGSMAQLKPPSDTGGIAAIGSGE